MAAALSCLSCRVAQPLGDLKYSNAAALRAKVHGTSSPTLLAARLDPNSVQASGRRSTLLSAQAHASTVHHPCSNETSPSKPPGGLRWIGTLVTVAALLAVVPPAAKAAAAASTGHGSPNILSNLLGIFLHLDTHLGQIIAEHGTRTYAILFGIVFCETGLILTPFLPGDSLLFAAGTFAALGSLRLMPLLAVFIIAATLGDAVNYAVGHFFGARIAGSRLVNDEYLHKTRTFYDRHGSRAVVLARFLPIVRTFAPFVAGVGNMRYSTFALCNVGGAVLWSVLFVGAGYFFGNFPVVRDNFALVIVAIVAVSVLPVLAEVWNARRNNHTLEGS